MSQRDLMVTAHGAWFQGRRYPCVVGRGGIVPAECKREGDGATPDGVHRIVGALYRPDRMARPMTWALPIGPNALWSDDPRDPDYNLLTYPPHAFSHERLRRADPLYDLVLLTDWNWPYAVPGRGSAIFIHRWRRAHAPTAGCVGLAPHDLLWIAQRLNVHDRLIVKG
jgi:L,D-peptidoglycan transpeptidase YkuD (ErfK/YbiS/YcfS/YnhG family)